MLSANLGRGVREAPADTLSCLQVHCHTLISILSLLLLVYTGYGETLLTYKKLEQEQAQAQAGLVRSSIESALHSGITAVGYCGD